MTDRRAPRTPAGLAEPRVMPPGQRRSQELRPVNYGRVPRINLSTWRLSIGGETASGEVTALGWDEVIALSHVEIMADHHCVAKYTTQDLRWFGVAARAIVDRCPPAAGAEFVQLWATYGYSSTVRLEDLLSARAVFATHLDGAPLTPEHGWPMRVVLPHLYGFKGPKWVAALDYHHEPVRGFWEQRGYHVLGDVWREERYSHQE